MSAGKYAAAMTQEMSLADAKNRGAIKGLVTMRINFLLSQANADARQNLNKTPTTFETDAWYVSNGTAKEKEDESER